MKTLKVVCNRKTYEIRRNVIIYVLSGLCNEDFSKADDAVILETMKSYHLIDENTLKSMAEYQEA